MTRYRDPLILLEGPDGAGKTTLMETLTARLRERHITCSTHHSGVPTVHPMVEYVEVLLRLHDAQVPAVVDRLHLGEQTYGHIVRGNDQLGRKGVYAIDRLITRLFNPLLVIVLPPRDVAFQNWVKRKGQEYVKDEDKYMRIYEGFNDAVSLLPRVYYDYTSTEAAELVDRMVVHLIAGRKDP